MSTKITRLWFQSTSIRDDGDFLCLTDMWRAAGSDEGKKRPSDWLALESAREFREYLETTLPGGSLTRATEGRGGATWAHWQLALAYAKYLSPAFHAWCNDVVRAVMQGRLAPAAGDSAAALELAREALAFARDVSRRLDFIERHVATGGAIPAPRFRELRDLVKETAVAMVAGGRRASLSSARATVWSRLRDGLGWGGNGRPWSEMPATLEPAARALLRAMRKDFGPGDRQLALVRQG